MAKINCDVRCNWLILNDRSLNDAVSCKSNLCDSEDELDDVSFESCVHLGRDENKESKCTLTLNEFEANVGYKQLIVISEAKNIEFYNDKGEYILTANSDFVTKIDEFTVYKAIIHFPNALKSCVIKLLSLPNPQQVWVYGITLMVQTMSHETNSNLDLNKILDRIDQCEDKISNKAKKFADFLKSSRTNVDFTNANSASSLNMEQMIRLFKTFNSDKNNVISESGDTNTVESDTYKRLKAHSNDGNIVQGNDLNSLLTNIVRHELSAVEDRLWSRIENHLQALETRLMERMDQMVNLVEFRLKPVQIGEKSVSTVDSRANRKE